jgi:integrase/recombinase XerD
VARFVAWLRAPAENVIVLETGAGRRSAATVNRHLAAVFGFYDHHARAGVGVAGGWSPGGGSAAALISRSCTM